MSLDVYLDVYLDGGTTAPAGSGIFIREGGRTREISRAEWDRLHPGREPIRVNLLVEAAYHANITHNLGAMAAAAGLYECLWRPDEAGIVRAADLVRPLAAGLHRLLEQPDHYREFDPPNGWGSYDVLVGFVVEYLAACWVNPDATVRVDR